MLAEIQDSGRTSQYLLRFRDPLSMHFVVLGGRDPADEHTWSGMPKGLVESLRRTGHTVTTIGPLPPIETIWPRTKCWYYRNFHDLDYVTIRDSAVARARAPYANKLLREQRKADAVVTFHPADTAYLQCRAPLIFIHDATWHQLLDFYPRYARRKLPKETIEGGYQLDRAAIKNCDAAIYSSSWSANSVVSDYGLSGDKLTVHPFGANLPAPSEADLRRSIGQRGRGPCRLLFVGVDWTRKGGDIAVAIARQLRDRGVAVELQMVGCEVPSNCRNVASGLGFLSKKEPTQAARLAELFAAADFLLLPTRADCTPIVLSEAAANGLPVVAAKVGGIGEIVPPASWGLALEPNASPAEYANWIQGAYADRGAYERMAWSARHAYDKRLNWDSYCRHLVAIVKELPLAAVQHPASSSSTEPAHAVAETAFRPGPRLPILSEGASDT